LGGKKLYPYGAQRFAKDQVENFVRKPKRLIVPLPRLKGQDLRLKYDSENIPFLLIFGVGLGYHLEELIKRFNIQHAIAVEINPDLFKMSLSSINWKNVFNYFSKKGRTFSLIVNDDIQNIKLELIRKLMHINPGFHVFTFVFEHFDHEIYDELFNWMVQEIAKQPLTWGFFDDEVWSIEHTLYNVRKRIPVFVGKNLNRDETTPVFIVGAGKL